MTTTNTAIDQAEVQQALSSASTIPFWLDDDRRPEARERLKGRVTSELAIVGGGFTGLWTALLAKEQNPDCDVVLLEGGRIGWAASGRNGGFCSASLTHGSANGQNHLPHENARLEELGAENLSEIASAVKRYGMDCDFELTGEISLATQQYQVDELRALHQPEAGVEWLDEDKLTEHFRSPHVLGGLLDRHETALVNPARLCWELARVIEELGVRIFEHSPVRKLEKGSGASAGVALSADHGSVHAQHVALATNVFPALLASQRLRTVPVYDYALMTEPLTAEQLAEIGWQGREGLADTNNRFHYFRLTRDNRILWGGYDAVYHFGRQIRREYDQRPQTFETLVRNFYEMFPSLRGIRFTHKWGGAIDTCSRFFPFFATAAGGRVAYAAGFTGLGVGASRFAGRVMLDLLSGEDTELTRLDYVRKKPMPFPPEPLSWLGIKATTAAMIRSDERQGRRGPLLKILDALGIGFDS